MKWTVCTQFNFVKALIIMQTFDDENNKCTAAESLAIPTEGVYKKFYISKVGYCVKLIVPLSN